MILFVIINHAKVYQYIYVAIYYVARSLTESDTWPSTVFYSESDATDNYSKTMRSIEQVPLLSSYLSIY